MIVIKCNRCEKELQGLEGCISDTYYSMEINHHGIVSVESNIEPKEIHLCQECYDKFKQFIKDQK